jgi:hypothetical protein
MSTFRRFVSAALAACLSLVTFATACTEPETPVHVPVSGEWSYAETEVLADTCLGNFELEQRVVWVEYDGAFGFQADYVSCSIAGVEFSCSAYTSSHEIPGYDATVRSSVTWKGEFASDREASGTEVTYVACSGLDCSMIEAVQTLPCSRTATFEAKAV